MFITNILKPYWSKNIISYLETLQEKSALYHFMYLLIHSWASSENMPMSSIKASIIFHPCTKILWRDGGMQYQPYKRTYSLAVS